MRIVDELQITNNTDISIISELRRYHPLFEKLTFQGTRIVLKEGKFIKLKPAQVLFKEGNKEEIAYFIMYGKIVVRTMEEGTLGVASPGDSVGEEIALVPEYRYR